MYPLDIIVSYFLPSSIGWMFLVFVIVVEGALLSRLVSRSWLNIPVWLTAVLSNLTTTAIGYLVFSENHHGGHLLNWIPFDSYNGNLITRRIVPVFLYSLVGTLIVELAINQYLLRKTLGVPFRKSAFATLLVNLLTYATASGIVAYCASNYQEIF